MHYFTLGFVNFLIISASLMILGCDDNNNTVVQKTPPTEPIIQTGLRPSYLIDAMTDGELKDALLACKNETFYRSDFSIGHRGAAMLFPEHTKESYQAAIDSGAGIVECDVTFTSDEALVCRHSQCDLATTTNILMIPELASQCSVPFTPADLVNGVSATATCCTSDITLEQFKMLEGKMDGANSKALTAEEFMKGTPSWRTDLYAGKGTLMTHAQSIELFKSAGVKMTPELKAANVAMPFNGFSQNDYAEKMLNEYIAAGVSADQVYPQSFDINDIIHWNATHPDFANQAVYLDGRDGSTGFDHQHPDTWSPSMATLKEQGVHTIAPPLWMLVTLDNDGNIVPSEYAKAAKAEQFDIIAWTLERSGLLTEGGGWYYQSITDTINNEGDTYTLLDVLAKDVGVKGVFSDWPATVTYYANCMELTH